MWAKQTSFFLFWVQYPITNNSGLNSIMIVYFILNLFYKYWNTCKKQTTEKVLMRSKSGVRIQSDVLWSIFLQVTTIYSHFENKIKSTALKPSSTAVHSGQNFKKPQICEGRNSRANSPSVKQICWNCLGLVTKKPKKCC